MSDSIARRQLLIGTGASLLSAPAALGTPAVAAVREPVVRTLTTTLLGIGDYRQLPFEVPAGVTRIDVAMTKSVAAAKVGIGLFDARGAGYQSEGFRGVYGEERASFFVSASQASEAFLPGPMTPGTWTVLVPGFLVPLPTRVTVRVTLSFEPAEQGGQPFRAGPECGVVVDTPGWYRGDLHCHTPASSDAWASGSAMSPAQWADACRRTGLDFVALTDHNVITQNSFLARDAGADVLLLAGEEMTNWTYGHATVSGIAPGDWVDFRQVPQPQPLRPDWARVTALVEAVEGMGGYLSAAHPSGFHLAWQFTREHFADAAARTHGWEVWTGPWGLDDEASLATWNAMLCRGLRTVVNGGSDLHGVDNDEGFAVGRPTTVVYADRLAREDVVAALRAGRSYVTRRPDGVELHLTVTRPGQAATVGGTVWGDVGDPVEVAVRVRRGDGRRLAVWANGHLVRLVTVDGEDRTVTATVRIPASAGHVRAVVRGAPDEDQGDMEAISNPVWLEVGDVPAGHVAHTAPLPERPGPRRPRSGS